MSIHIVQLVKRVEKRGGGTGMEQTNKSLEQMVFIDEGHLFDDYYNGDNFNSLEPT